MAWTAARPSPEGPLQVAEAAPDDDRVGVDAGRHLASLAGTGRRIRILGATGPVLPGFAWSTGIPPGSHVRLRSVINE
jgi:hypothetical protein